MELCRSIAACAEIPFLYLASDRFPLAFITVDGEVAFAHSYADVASLLDDLPAHEQKGASEHPRDTGWSAYWRHLSQA